MLFDDWLWLLLDVVVWGLCDVVKVMVELGWLIDVCGGDWDVSVLNYVVFCGDVELLVFLFVYGVGWCDLYGFGSDVFGMLLWVLVNELEGVGEVDWEVCVCVLFVYGVLLVVCDLLNLDGVLIDGCVMWFFEVVIDVLFGSDGGWFVLM